MSHTIPNKQGQICKIVSTETGEYSTEEYILITSPEFCNADDFLTIVDIKDLQRNIHNPIMAPQKQVLKRNLVVIGEDLASYVSSWNKTS